MASWQILEWDLAHPIRKAFGLATPKYVDLRNLSFTAPPVITLRELGRRVEQAIASAARGKPSSNPVAGQREVNGRPRPEAAFMWVEVRMEIGDEEGLTQGDRDTIAADPLLHQRLFDAAQAPFSDASIEIAGAIKRRDFEIKRMLQKFEQEKNTKGWRPEILARKSGDLNQQIEFHRLLHAGEIGGILRNANKLAIGNLLNLKVSLELELGRRQTTWKTLKVGFKIFLGVTAIACCVVAAVATWGVAGGFLAGAAIAAGSRSLVDTSKALKNQLIEAEAVRKRLSNALVHFQESKGAKAIVAAVSGAMKVSAIGYDLLGIGGFASLSSLAEDVKLYEQKLCNMRSKAHELSRQVGDKLREMDAQQNAVERTKDLKIVPRDRPGAAEAWKGKTVPRSKAEIALHKLLVEIPKLHLACDGHLKQLPKLKQAVQQVVGSKGNTYSLFETWLDLSLGSFLSVIGGVGGAATWSGGAWSDVFTVIGEIDDVTSYATLAA